jgi:hypothetical protein
VILNSSTLQASAPAEFTACPNAINCGWGSITDLEWFDFDNVEFRGHPVPEPASWALILAAIVVSAGGARFRRNN